MNSTKTPNENHEEYDKQLEVCTKKLNELDVEIVMLNQKVDTLQMREALLKNELREAVKYLIITEEKLEKSDNKFKQLVDEHIEVTKNFVSVISGNGDDVLEVPPVDLSMDVAQLEGEIEAMKMYEAYQLAKINELLEIRKVIEGGGD